MIYLAMSLGAAGSISVLFLLWRLSVVKAAAAVDHLVAISLQENNKEIEGIYAEDRARWLATERSLRAMLKASDADVDALVQKHPDLAPGYLRDVLQHVAEADASRASSPVSVGASPADPSVDPAKPGGN